MTINMQNHVSRHTVCKIEDLMMIMTSIGKLYVNIFNMKKLKL